MKYMKKIMCLMLAVTLALGLGITALAAPDAPDAESKTYTITVREGDDHTYAVYQIFTFNEINADDKKILPSDVEWGRNGIWQEGKPVDADILKELGDAIVGDVSDSDLLKVVGKYVNFGGMAYMTVAAGSPATVPMGYYLIRDDSTTAGDGDGDVYIVQVVGDVTIKRKSGTPKVEKKVQENSTEIYQDYADYDIGDHVPFELIGSLPENYDMYDAYKYYFHDTLSEGFTYDEGSVKVYKVTVGADGKVPDTIPGAEGNPIEASHYKVEADKNTLDILFDVVKNKNEDDNPDTDDRYDDKGLKDVVENYSADTRIVVRYTATLNAGAKVGNSGNSGNPNEVCLEFSNNPNSGGEGDTGTTPPDKVVVFTYELDGTKVDGQTKAPLAGAEFKLYRLKSDQTTKEYVQITDGAVSGWTEDEKVASVLTSDANGRFKVVGLDAGDYYLEETKAPAGYNVLGSVITLTITPTMNEDGTQVDQLKAEVTIGAGAADPTAADGDPETGVVAISVENNKGSALPRTGGIGTTVFYIIGSVLVIGCSAILIVRKRFGKKN